MISHESSDAGEVTRPLRIAVLSPLAWRTPPRSYGPWEQFASLLTEGLVAAGHDVTLFATADSVTTATLVATSPVGWSDDPTIDPKVAECIHIASVFERAAEFDVIHNGFDFLPLTYSGLVRTPVVTTIHGFSSERILPVYERYDASTDYVAISDSDRHPRLHYAATVHHGIDTAEFRCADEVGEHLLYFGRIHPDKGTAHAIEVARRCGRRLDIAGIVQDDEYFRNEVEPHIDGEHVRYLGAVGVAERCRTLGEAHALLHLIDFDEPFGYSVVEALACGTPVIAHSRGSMPELIDDGCTGVLVSDIDGAVAATSAVATLDRAAVRAVAVERFDVSRMVAEYVSVYRSVLEQRLIPHDRARSGGVTPRWRSVRARTIGSIPGEVTDMASYPKHVNHELGPMGCPLVLGDVDLFGEGAQEHWYEAYEILHRDAPVLRIEGGGLTPGSDAYVLTKHEDVSRVVKDTDRFTSLTTKRLGHLVEQGLTPEEAYDTHHNLMQASMLSLRPTQQLYFQHRRELTDPWVGAGALRHREMITQHANDLIDDWTDDGEVEFVGGFARPLPQRVMATILGFPLDDIGRLAAWGDAAVTPFVHGGGLKHELTPEQTADMLERLDGFQEYIYDHVAEKRRNPQDDMVSFLCDVRYQALDRRLTDLEIAGIVHAMILGGLETTQYALEEQAQLLCEHPGLFEQLRGDRSRVRAFTEEGLRMRSPTHGLSTRMTSQDEVFHGVAVPAGSLLHLRFGAANVDPDEFACPFELDLDREAVTRHLAFSSGPRVCPGATLSRVEQQIAWGVLLDRFETIEYGDGNDWLHQPGIMLGTLKLRLRFRRAEPPSP